MQHLNNALKAPVRAFKIRKALFFFFGFIPVRKRTELLGTVASQPPAPQKLSNPRNIAITLFSLMP
jgi:hypothetical protein